MGSVPGMQSYGVTSMTAPLRRVLVRKPALHGDFAGAAWREPDPAALARQHEAFVELLDRLGPSVEVAEALDGQVDSVYMHDPVLVTGRGAIPLRMAKPARQAEPAAMAAELERLGVPVLGTLSEPAYADGGDRFWLDDATMAIGLGYRTNLAGVEAVRRLVEPEGVAVEAYDMPHDQGPASCCTSSPSSPASPTTSAWSTSRSRPCGCSRTCGRAASTGSRSRTTTTWPMGCNVLAVRPGVVVMVDGVPGVRRALEARGVEVHVYAGSELSLKGDGGPTCLTAPLLRGER